jgi:hypothetical protein
MKRRAGQDYFHQPCSAHLDAACAIYDQRPQRCRLFNCRQLLLVTAGEISEDAALEKIHNARRRAMHVDVLIHRIAETNPRRALAQRCANALTTAERTPSHDELEAAMQALETLLETDFRVK